MTHDSDHNKLDELSARISKAQEAADPTSRQKSWGQSSRRMMRVVHIGSDFVALVVVPTMLGGYLDQEFGTEPWLMLFLLIAGFIVGFVHIVKALDDKGGKGQDSAQENEE